MLLFSKLCLSFFRSAFPSIFLRKKKTSENIWSSLTVYFIIYANQFNVPLLHSGANFPIKGIKSGSFCIFLLEAKLAFLSKNLKSLFKRIIWYRWAVFSILLWTSSVGKGGQLFKPAAPTRKFWLESRRSYVSRSTLILCLLYSFVNYDGKLAAL